MEEQHSQMCHCRRRLPRVVRGSLVQQLRRSLHGAKDDHVLSEYVQRHNIP